MHELGIAQEMLKVALDYAAKNNATRITAFNIAISATADESEDSLRFHLENLTRGTIADGAHFTFEHIPVQAHCLDCFNEFTWQTPDQTCPRCSSSRMRIMAQDEFRLTSIDAE